MAFLKRVSDPSIVEVTEVHDWWKENLRTPGRSPQLVGGQSVSDPAEAPMRRVSLKVGPKHNTGEWLVSAPAIEAQLELPLRLMNKDALIAGVPAEHALWLYNNKCYLTKDRELTAEDVRALVNVEMNKRRLALEKAHALQAMTTQLEKPRRRDRIPQQIRIEVWQRDGGCCVECASQENLEFDHIIPFAMGGSNTARNLQLLCGDCNRRKGMTLG